MEEENMVVDEGFDDIDSDLELPEDIVEDEQEPEESLDSLTGEEPAEEEPKTQGTSEPGYIQKRINKALARERESMKADIMAELEAQYAPIKERLLEMDAKELVKQGEFKSIERAKEYLQLKQGVMPTESQPEAAQPRQANGQFAPREDPATTAKIDMLAHQADVIREKTGMDVIDVFSNNADIKQKVISGELDFYDVADMIGKQPKRRAPAPTRSPNGASGQNHNAIDSMSDDQFERMERKIRDGARYSLK